MNGREKFKKYKFVLNIIINLSKITPKWILNFLWNITNVSENKISLLIRYIYVKKYSNKCGDNVYVGKHVTIKNINKLSLGSNISIHAYCYIDAYGNIEIGDNVSIANHTSIISFEHTWGNKTVPIKYNPTKTGKVILSDDVWIGSGCRILSDVIIGNRCIVAAGAVVNKDVPSNTIVGGVPIKPLKKI